MKAVKQDGHVQMFGPTSSKPGIYRILNRADGKQVERTAKNEREATMIFDQMVRADRAKMPSFARKGSSQKALDITALADITVSALKDNDLSTRYVEKIEDVLRLHVLPIIGNVAVEDWSIADSKKVLATARGPKNARKLGDASVQDVGAAMRAMVTQAHRTKPRLLLKDDDPMEGVRYSVGSTNQGQSASYIPPNQRPTTEAVTGTYDFLKRRSETHLHGQKPGLLGRPWMALPVIIMGYGGLRLGECLALRPKDIQGTRILVNGTVEGSNRPGVKPVRKETKNRRKRKTFIPKWASPILAAYVEQFTDPEAPLFPDSDGNWTRTNNYWKIATGPAIDAGVWNPDVDFENLRHHAATYWHDAGIPIETISQLLGHHSVSFTYETYFRTHKDSLNQAESLVDLLPSPDFAPSSGTALESQKYLCQTNSDLGAFIENLEAV
jgi:integrase